VARFIRASATRSMVALWVISGVDALLFFTTCMIALPWLSNWLLPHRVPLPFWPRAVAGVVLFVGGLALWAVCVDAFIRRGRGTPLPLEAPRQLVTTGAFAVVRNPIIAADAAVVWGVALFLSSLGVLLYATLFTLFWNYIVVHVEEPELRGRFGKQYEAYCRRVPRWFPAGRTR